MIDKSDWLLNWLTYVTNRSKLLLEQSKNRKFTWNERKIKTLIGLLVSSCDRHLKVNEMVKLWKSIENYRRSQIENEEKARQRKKRRKLRRFGEKFKSSHRINRILISCHSHTKCSHESKRENFVVHLNLMRRWPIWLWVCSSDSILSIPKPSIYIGIDLIARLKKFASLQTKSHKRVINSPMVRNFRHNEKRKHLRMALERKYDILRCSTSATAKPVSIIRNLPAFFAHKKKKKLAAENIILSVISVCIKVKSYKRSCSDSFPILPVVVVFASRYTEQPTAGTKNYLIDWFKVCNRRKSLPANRRPTEMNRKVRWIERKSYGNIIDERWRQNAQTDKMKMVK